MTNGKTIKYLQLLIENELQNIYRKPEAPEDAPFGKYLFAPIRKNKGIPYEKNTPEEEEFLHALKKHYKGKPGQTGAKELLVSMFPKLLDLVNQGKYEFLLKPPSVPLYRVINYITPKVLSARFGIAIEDIKKTANKVAIVNKVNSEYTPRGNIASWTVRNNISELVHFIHPRNGEISVLLETFPSIGGNFLINPYNLSDETKRKISVYIPEEMEVISYGPVKITKAVFFYRDKQATVGRDFYKYSSAVFEEMVKEMVRK